jgi:adenine C2-methylase RlmN of 23S rRNA A2503 and tRNA A37
MGASRVVPDSTPYTTVVHRPAHFNGYATGALDIAVAGRRVLSIPTQLGCRVGCRFCVSRDTPLVRNLTVGEPLLNWKNTTSVTKEVVSQYPEVFRAVRYCFSGLAAMQLLPKAQDGQLPVRLQLSLHAARQVVRDSLIPRSESLDVILAALRSSDSQFAAIELNVVLQDGVNDSDADLEALMQWGDASWPILLNPLLADGQEVVASRTRHFAAVLRSAGREVKTYSKVGSLISRQGIYPLMSARSSSSRPAAAGYTFFAGQSI